MNAGQFRTGIVSLLMVLAICGAAVSSVWNDAVYSFDTSTLHVRNVVSHDPDVGEVVFSKIHPDTVCICSSPFQPLSPAIGSGALPVVHSGHSPLSYITDSFPSRAPPA